MKMFVLVGRVLSLFGGRNQEIVIQRANSLLIIVPNSSVCCAKITPTPSQWPTAYSLRKVYCGGEVSLHTSAPLHPLMMISARGTQAPKEQGDSRAKWWNIEWHFKAKCTALLCSINKWCIRKYRKALSSKLYSWQQVYDWMCCSCCYFYQWF